MPTPATCRCVASSTPGIAVALGADDPLLFGSRLVAQYAAARDLGFDDAELARARPRLRSRAAGCRPPARQAALADVDAWLAAPA